MMDVPVLASTVAGIVTPIFLKGAEKLAGTALEDIYKLVKKYVWNDYTGTKDASDETQSEGDVQNAIAAKLENLLQENWKPLKS